MRLFYAFIFLFLSITSFSQSKIQELEIHTSQIPTQAKHKGGIVDLVKWKDVSGTKFVILCETGRLVDKGKEHDDEIASAELHAYCYLLTNGTVELKWKISDFVNDCPFDITASFLNNTLKVTDLDNDGLAEVWVMYKVTCRSDVSPCNMKIIMYEDQTKHAMRGETKVPATETTSWGGEYKFDEAFEKAPKKFRDFALKLWNDNVMENWGK
jgi:hypothetical protein